jgi:CTP:molybdopterin cytidylyltransferase MocA
MRRMIQRPWLVLLAAGASRRYGRPKQLARVGGESLLRRMVRVALASDTAGCIVVLGARAARLQGELRGMPVRIVVNPRWRMGLSASLAAGLAAVPTEARAALVLLADQAAVGPAELELLLAAWRASPGRPAAAIVACTLGPPAILPRRLFRPLSRLRGDRGAREFLRTPSSRTVGIELPSAAIDIDRPADLARLERARRN